MNDKHAPILVVRKESQILRNTGFRRNKGCTDKREILTTEIIKAFEERNIVSAYSTLKAHTTASTAAF
jgi:hypothetical protein